MKYTVFTILYILANIVQPVNVCKGPLLMCQFYGIGANTSNIESVMATQTFRLIILETVLGIKYEFHFL